MIDLGMISDIRDGTVIDHLPAGSALNVLWLALGCGPGHPEPTTTYNVGMNQPSKRSGKEDIIKIEDRELTPDEYHKIALVAWAYGAGQMPTINTIKKYKVTNKTTPELADRYERVVDCHYPDCITNNPDERELGRKTVLVRREDKFYCDYCRREQEPKEVREGIELDMRRSMGLVTMPLRCP